jgi:TonB family protein
MMVNYFNGLIESVFVISLFGLLYISFFNKEASFKQNRFFLMLGVLLGILVPFVEFSAPENAQFQQFIKLASIDVSTGTAQEADIKSSFTWISLIYVLYVLGIIFFFLKFIVQLIKIFSFLKGADIRKDKNATMVFTGKRHPVFSFLGYIFIDEESQHSKDLNIIINHERVHVAQNHSIALLLFEVLAIVQWFNPFIWWYRKTIKQNHEFLADKGLLQDGFAIEKYQEILLRNYSFMGLGLTNSFNHSLTFKRLLMMKKNSSNRKSLLKFIVLVPVLIVSVYFISCTKEQVAEEETSNSRIETLDEKSSSSDEVVVIGYNPESTEKVYDLADVMPEYPGGELELRKFIAKNIKYPSQAREAGIQGKVFVKFVVSKTGAVTNVEAVRSVDPLLDAEAVRVVSSQPEWKPAEIKGEKVNVNYTVPINFRLQ